MQLLGRHAGELTARDGTAWSADLDDAAAAAGYRSRQQAVFGNLAGVPLATWRYVLVAPVTDPAVIGPAAARLGGRAVLLHVDLQYALAVVDPAPTAQGAVADRGPPGRWLAAGGSDTDAAELGGPSWRGPWDFGPLIARAGPHTLVLAHPAHAGDAATFGALVEHVGAGGQPGLGRRLERARRGADPGHRGRVRRGQRNRLRAVTRPPSPPSRWPTRCAPTRPAAVPAARCWAPGSCSTRPTSAGSTRPAGGWWCSTS